MTKRPCLDCGISTYGTRCPACERFRQAVRNRTRKHLGGTWPALSRAMRRAQPWCSICGTPYDLTADHVKPRSLEHGAIVLCRQCNARKGDR